MMFSRSYNCSTNHCTIISLCTNHCTIITICTNHSTSTISLYARTNAAGYYKHLRDREGTTAQQEFLVATTHVGWPMKWPI